MTIIRSFLESYGTMLLYAILTAIAGTVGTQIKRIYNRFVNDQTKKSVVSICVRAVEQLYTALHGAEKKQKAKEAVFAMLTEKGIPITPLEMDLLIESVVAEFNEKVQ